MSQVIKINAITVPEGSGDELAKRFAARAGAVDDQDGFEGFELLQPTDERTTWLVVTRWRDEAAFEAWVSSPAFGHGHRSEQERAGGDTPPAVSVSPSSGRTRSAGGSDLEGARRPAARRFGQATDPVPVTVRSATSTWLGRGSSSSATGWPGSGRWPHHRWAPCAAAPSGGSPGSPRSRSSCR